MSNILFSPMRLGNLSLKNRVVIPPMCQYSAKNGLAGDWHKMHYGKLACSGAGILIVEATAVAPEGRISPEDLGLWSDETESALSAMLKFIRNCSDMLIFLQLAHAGRKASHYRPWVSEGGTLMPQEKGGWQTVAPSPLPYLPGNPAPSALDEAGCVRIKKAFAEAAARAASAGFDGIEVHAAHGYLLHQFLSPLSNQRKDKYGGSSAARMRFPLEVFEAVRQAFPAQKPVGLRLSGQDWVAGGWNVQESVGFVHELAKLGCAYAHISGGGLAPEQELNIRPGYQVDMAAHVKKETGMTTIAVGLITDALQAETILVSGQADLVAIGRGILYNPQWPWHAAAALGAAVDAPPQYWRSAPHGVKGLFNVK